VQGGMLELVTGPMFAGKTEFLLERLAAIEAHGYPVLAVKPRVDTRWPDSIVSHSGARRHAVSVRNGSELVGLADGYKLVGIDEAQFFESDLIDAVAELRRATQVVVAALDFDFRGELFAIVPELVNGADVVRRVQAVCGACGGRATLTQRFVDGLLAPFSDAVIRVGGDELYAPRCSRCYGAEREAASAQTA
jgi:thymidine kinase